MYYVLHYILRCAPCSDFCGFFGFFPLPVFTTWQRQRVKWSWTITSHNMLHDKTCKTFFPETFFSKKCGGGKDSASDLPVIKNVKTSGSIKLSPYTYPSFYTIWRESEHMCFNKLALYRKNWQHVNRITLKSEWISNLYPTGKSKRCQCLFWTLRKDSSSSAYPAFSALV